MKKAFLLYIPVIHRGHLELFKRHPDTDTVILIGESLLGEFSSLHKEIRALSPSMIVDMIRGAEILDYATVAEKNDVDIFTAEEIVTTREVITERVIERYFPDSKVTYDHAFLRWDERSVFAESTVHYDRISNDPEDIRIMEELGEEGQKSGDWWRRVGVGVVIDGKLILKHHNHHVPSQDTPYINGDPRDVIKAGERSEVATAFHAEASLIAQAADGGIRLRGASLYTTVFPCPTCAKMVAYSGVKKCFFAAGHASLDGETILRSRGVELIFVQKLNS